MVPRDKRDVGGTLHMDLVSRSQGPQALKLVPSVDLVQPEGQGGRPVIPDRLSLCCALALVDMPGDSLWRTRLPLM